MKNFRIETLKIESFGNGRNLLIYPTLLLNENEGILIDTAYPGQYDILKKEIEKHISLDKLSTIILTHHDIDHIGNLKKFKEEFPNITILSSSIEADYISGKKEPLKLTKLSQNVPFVDEATNNFYHMLKTIFPTLYTDVDKTFEFGDTLNLITNIEVIGTPGHTLGHVCLYIPEEKALIAGDTMSLANNKIELINEFYNYDTKEAKNSLKKLENYEIEKVLCYHGGEYIGKIDLEILGVK
ncbi:MAG: MBL fold metallo-hydrolase [Sarcina sp.]